MEENVTYENYYNTDKIIINSSIYTIRDNPCDTLKNNLIIGLISISTSPDSLIIFLKIIKILKNPNSVNIFHKLLFTGTKTTCTSLITTINIVFCFPLLFNVDVNRNVFI